jgi:hypothetical protein
MPSHGLGHFVIHFKDDTLGPVVAITFLLVLSADDCKGVKDVSRSMR